MEVRLADVRDAFEAATCVNAAFKHYVKRIGRPPAPMLADYVLLAIEGKVWVASMADQVVGVLVQYATAGGFYIDTVAVSPTNQGTGVGRALLEFAEREARQRGFESIYLCTNSAMTENLMLYPKIGYVELERRPFSGHERVFFRKRI